MNIWMIQKNQVKHNYLEKKDFYSHLIKEDITDADFVHAKRVEIKKKIS